MQVVNNDHQLKLSIIVYFIYYAKLAVSAQHTGKKHTLWHLLIFINNNYLITGYYCHTRSGDVFSNSIVTCSDYQADPCQKIYHSKTITVHRLRELSKLCTKYC